MDLVVKPVNFFLGVKTIATGTVNAKVNWLPIKNVYVNMVLLATVAIFNVQSLRCRVKSVKGKGHVRHWTVFRYVHVILLGWVKYVNSNVQWVVYIKKIQVQTPRILP